ncbi:MAG: hypothetical protein QOJ32_2256 [Frankiaceae bacterium]|jgi:hypothetical protein|nr:hypothetical protein [Frankiaceae bacterium]MDQ1635447.1 hypothetical protein [Frankiaceae bacterium]MDQ1674200.1 hypothetical protein [Frankiaceae bacterium]
MHARSLLGPADVDDEDLARMVAASLGVSRVELLDSTAVVAAYDLEALTTAGRFWVSGTARHDGGVAPYAFFVKVVQCWSRSPMFTFVPEHLREVAQAGVPWRSEPLVYGSDLGVRLPPGLSLPRAHAVFDLDELSAAIWLDAVDVDETPWDQERFGAAARLLGRLAASPAVRALAGLGRRDVVRGYTGGRLALQVIPALQDESLWRHPLVADAFDDHLRRRLLDAVEALPEFLNELDAMPLGTAHGDACPRNLLVERGHPNAFVAIDFGFWCEAPLGFDLSQLLLGEVQTGERSAAELGELEELCLREYMRGLADEGCEAGLEQVRRAHALLMLIFTGVSAVPLEHLGIEPTPELKRLARERAAATKFILDLVDITMPAASSGRRG